MNQPVVRVDTDGRCAAMLVYGSRLVVLPFRREMASAEPVEGIINHKYSTDLLHILIISLFILKVKRREGRLGLVLGLV